MTDYEKLKGIIDEIDVLVCQKQFKCLVKIITVSINPKTGKKVQRYVDFNQGLVFAHSASPPSSILQFIQQAAA